MKRTRVPFGMTSLASAVALALLGGGAAAQTTPTTDPANKEQAPAETPQQDQTSLEAVVVTAQGFRQNALRVPYNISVIGGDALNERRIVDQNQLLREVAGASVVDRGPRNAGVVSNITIRGLNVNGAAVGDYQLSTVPAVSTYVNDTPIFANFLLKDLNRVEVLRGPQGTLYGSGSMGGTIRYITNAPELKQFSGTVDASTSRTDGSSGNNYSADLVLNIPVGDVVALRVAAGTLRSAGVVDYVNVYRLDSSGNPVAPLGVANPAASFYSEKDADSSSIDYTRVAALLKPTAEFWAQLTYQAQRDDVDGRRQPTRPIDGVGGTNGLGVPYGKYENGSIQLEPSSRTVQLTALELGYDFGFATLTSATSYYNQSGDSTSENTGFYAQNRWLRNYYYNYPRPMAQAQRTYGDRAFVEDLRLVSKPGGMFDYVAGLFYQDQTLNQTQQSYLRGFKNWADTVLGPGIVLTDQDYNYELTQKVTQLAAYGELTWNISNAWRLLGGLRLFKNDIETKSEQAVPVYGLFPPTAAQSSQSDDGVIWKINSSYEFAPQNLVYGTIATGYRRGGANAVPTAGPFAENSAYLKFDSDRTTNYEIGVKGQISDWRLRYSAAAFYINWDDIQLDVATPNWGFFAAQNGGKARSQGFELELNGRFLQGGRYALSYAYVDAKTTENVILPGATAGTTTVYSKSGSKLPGVATNTIFGLLEYSAGFGEWQWTNALTGHYQSSSENSLANGSARNIARFGATWPSFSIWNLYSTLSYDKWTAQFFVKNLFNEAGITGGFKEQYMGTSPSQNYYGNGSKVFIADPRTIGVSLAYSF